MQTKKVKLWYDSEGDMLEVTWATSEGATVEPTAHSRVMETIDEEGNVLGFMVQGVSHIKGSPFEIELGAESAKFLVGAEEAAGD
jgi:hypothetical protein